MRYRRIQESHFTHIVLSGRLTGQDAEVMRVLITEIKIGQYQKLLINLSELTFIDSAGVGMLLVLNGEATSSGRTVALCHAEQQVKRVLELTRLNMIIPIYPTINDFIEARVLEAAVVSPDACAVGEDPVALAAHTLAIAPRVH